MSATIHMPAAPPSAALRSLAAQWRSRVRDPLTPLREQAMQQFLKLGLPTLKDDSWLHTNLRSLASQNFIDAPHRARGEIEPNASLSLLGKSDRAASLLMVNGIPALPEADGLIDGIEINSLRDVSRMYPDKLRRYLETPADNGFERFTLLNTALFVDGLHLRITAPVSVPVVILHVGAADGAGNIAYPRVIIEAAPGSKATIIEHYVAEGDNPPLNNSHSDILLEDGAHLEHYRVYATGAEATHLDSLRVQQGKDSHFTQFTIVLGGGLVRASLEAHLNRPGATIDSYSLLVGHGERHVDCVNVVTHGAADTRSNQTARAIASDHSRVIFNSKVIVQPGAVHAHSQQSCRGLLLSPSAEIDTRPQLEIHADEVKCAHGATVGRLDPGMLFYMLSRGLDRDTAQSLLVYAFLADVLTGMSVASARTAIENALIAQLPDSQTLRNFR